MKLVDANVLVYACNEDAALHEPSRAFLQKALGGGEPVGFAWVVLLAFVRVATKPLFPQPLSVTDALDIVDEWLAQPAAVIVGAGPRHAAILRALLAPLGTGGNLTSDAHLAALAIEHGATLYSFDHDFGRFPGLTWRSPSSSSAE